MDGAAEGRAKDTAAACACLKNMHPLEASSKVLRVQMATADGWLAALVRFAPDEGGRLLALRAVLGASDAADASTLIASLMIGRTTSVP